MRGSINYQVQTVFKTVNEISTSKHDAKVSARAGGAVTWHEIGKEMGIKSYATADAYRDVWRDMMKYAKSELRIKDIEKLSGENIKTFLLDKIEQGVAHATFGKYAAALEKLEVALNRYGEQNKTGSNYLFSKEIAEARVLSKDLERFKGSRAFQDPDKLIQVVRGERFQLAGAIQRESGARVSEANHITKGHLQGMRADLQTGDLKGWIKVKGKGGKVREIGVKPDTYARLEKAVNAGRFEFKAESYRVELKTAALKTNQTYQGSHGLRWSWAQERHQALQRNGMTYEQTISRVSHEMGHARADITEHYLR